MEQHCAELLKKGQPHNIYWTFWQFLTCNFCCIWFSFEWLRKLVAFSDFFNFSGNFHTISPRFENSGILYQRQRSVLKHGGGGGGVGGSSLCQDYSSTRIFQNVYGCSRTQTNFFAMSPVFNVFVMDLQQCNRRQFFRWFFIVFMVLLRYVFSLRRAENVLSTGKSPIPQVMPNKILTLCGPLLEAFWFGDDYCWKPR